MKTPYALGSEAYHAGDDAINNPFCSWYESESYDEWYSGFVEARWIHSFSRQRQTVDASHSKFDTDPFDLGQQAYYAGKPIGSNPYDCFLQPEKWRKWWKGFESGTWKFFEEDEQCQP